MCSWCVGCDLCPVLSVSVSARVAGGAGGRAEDRQRFCGPVRKRVERRTGGPGEKSHSSRSAEQHRSPRFARFSEISGAISCPFIRCFIRVSAYPFSYAFCLLDEDKDGLIGFDEACRDGFSPAYPPCYPPCNLPLPRLQPALPSYPLKRCSALFGCEIASGRGVQ